MHNIITRDATFRLVDQDVWVEASSKCAVRFLASGEFTPVVAV